MSSSAAGLLHSIDQSTQLAGHNRLALLLFRVGARAATEAAATAGHTPTSLLERQLFGINVFKVQEVIPRPALTWLPSAHPRVCGVAEIRGRVIPVLDLAAAVGGEPTPSDAAAHVIVAEFNRTVQGFLVRSVERIIHVDVSEVHPPPDSGSHGYLTAITRQAGELVEIVDVEKVLSDVLGEAPSISEELMQAAKTLQDGRRILVADDSRVARAQVERILGQLGIECLLVNDGREALRTLQGLADQGVKASERFSMVISDVEMPDLDGYTLATEIRRDARLKDLYVILHTSLSGVFNNAMVQRVGADRFIPKFSPNELAQAVLERLQTRH